jgi:hypothetical protein
VKFKTPWLFVIINKSNKGGIVFFRASFIFLLVLNYSYASYEKVSIGDIDSSYSDKITKQQLRVIIKEIENIFEQQLGFNVFDLDKQGKPIDLIYMPSSKAKQTVLEGIETLKKKKREIEIMQEYFLSKKEYMQSTKAKLQKQQRVLNEQVRSLNDYIQKANNRKIDSRSEMNEIRRYINKRKRVIQSSQNRFEQRRIKFNNFLSAYNQKIFLYNSLIRSFNRLQRKIEVIARSIKEIKGAAIGYKKVIYETVEKNGVKQNRRIEENYMGKIEIYGFESLKQLKAILAHELAHLVGVGHIEKRGALMNPVLQDGQVMNLRLTNEDIKAFKEVF